MKQAPNPTAAEAQVERHAAELRVELPSTWREDVGAGDSGKAFNNLVGNLQGQLVASKPKLVPYFEAAYNLIFRAGKSDLSSLKATASNLDLPMDIREPGKDALAWLNRVHDHFEAVLRERAG